MSGYQRRTNRGTHPEWWPHIHDLPINSATWNEFVNLPPLQLGEDVPTVYKKDLSSHRPGVKIRLALINFCHSEVSERRMADVEDICVAEADRLGLNYVGIRQGPHNSESVYTDGCPTMIRDPKTGRMKKMQRQADWHITVVFGRSVNELLLHGHIYINWYGNASTEITIVTDPESQRTFFYDGPKVATQYWGVVRGDTLPLKALQ